MLIQLRVRLAQFLAYGSGNIEVPIRDCDTGSNPSVTHRLLAIHLSPVNDEKLLRQGYDYTVYVPGLNKEMLIHVTVDLPSKPLPLSRILPALLLAASVQSPAQFIGNRSVRLPHSSTHLYSLSPL